MKTTIRERVPKNTKYYFIKISELKLCFTNDYRMDSDNEKFEAGNYFYTHDAAMEVADLLQDKFADKLRSISYGERVNDRGFIKAVNGLVEKYKLRKKAEAMPEAAADALLAEIDAYNKEKSGLSAQRREIMDNIHAIISKAPKE